MVTKVDLKLMKNRGFFLGRLLETKIAGWWVRLGHFWSPFLIRNRPNDSKGSPKGAQSRKNAESNIYTKIETEKDVKSMPKGCEKDAKEVTEIIDFSCFFKKLEKSRNCLFSNRKRGSRHVKMEANPIENRSKIET